MPALAHPLRGRTQVARALINYWANLTAHAPELSVRFVEVNGGPGAIYLDAEQRLVAVAALDIAGGQVSSICAVVNPDKLTHLGPVGDFRALLGSSN